MHVRHTACESKECYPDVGMEQQTKSARTTRGSFSDEVNDAAEMTKAVESEGTASIVAGAAGMIADVCSEMDPRRAGWHSQGQRVKIKKEKKNAAQKLVAMLEAIIGSMQCRSR